MTTTYILVDFENTQPTSADIALARGEHLRLWVFRGPNQRKYDAEFTEALLALGEARSIKCAKSGPNALDMHIAFEMGRLMGASDASAGAPAVEFAVVSKDRDYDALLQYIAEQGGRARRVSTIKAAISAAPKSAPKTGKPKAIAEATAKKAAPVESAPGPSKSAAKGATRAPASAQLPPAADADPIASLADKVIAPLRKARPTKQAKLEKWLESHLRGKLPESELHRVIAELQRRELLQIVGTKVEYPQWG